MDAKPSMADTYTELDSEGVYVGMSLEEFGVRTSSQVDERDPKGVHMSKESLRKAIDHLQGELASGKPLSGEDRSQLDRVLSEVGNVLESSPGSEDSESGIVDDLRDFSERFEESHPELALLVGRVMDALSQLGF